MKATTKIDPPEWMMSAPVMQVMALLDGLSDKPKSLFVGGAVRNMLIGRSVEDIDIATTLTPDEVINRCHEQAGVKVIPTGIKHGTVTVVIDGCLFEVTTLRRDDKTDGRHAEISYTGSWHEDVKRRDFTMNSLLANISGHIYDLSGRGVEDLRAGRVIFVGEAHQRIQEDYLRILRFFRFHACYGEGEPDAGAYKACCDLADGINGLSRERITQELSKILSSKKAALVMRLMFQGGVLTDLIDRQYEEKILQSFCHQQDKHDAVDIAARFFALSGGRANLFERFLRLTHAQKKFIIKLEMIVNSVVFDDEKIVKKAIFHHGRDLLLQGYLYKVATGQVEQNKEMIEMIKTWTVPECPVNGTMLIAQGYETGPELGQELARLQEEWLEENL